MGKWQKNRTRGIWSFAWLYALLFHQLLPVLLDSSSFESQTFIVIAIYFGVITFFFTWLFLFLPAWLVGIFLFVFGGFMETFLFGVLPNFWLGGFFYVGMFFVPRWFASRIWTTDKETE